MPIDLEDQDCSLCRFFIDDGNHLSGECHRTPPRIKRRTDTGESRNAGIWPAVQAFDWCGEFQEKPNV